MKKNIGPKNRIARLAAGLIILAVSWAYLDKNSAWFYAGVIVWILLMLKAAGSYCIVHGIRGTKDTR